MAIYHCSIKIGSRSKGQSAIAASAYRSGTKMIDNETGLISDYTRKGGIIYSEVSLCENAPIEYVNREILWNAVHEIEKSKNARLWREIEVALPHELNTQQQIATVQDFVKLLTKQGMCADWSLHDKGDGNPHAHIMLTTRPIEKNGEWSKLKEKKEYALDDNGERIPIIDENTGQQKIDNRNRKQWKRITVISNEWNKTERVEEWRQAWAECCNSRLSEYNRIDHRSYIRQGIKQIPTIHEGYAARQIMKNRLSERVEVNNRIIQANLEINQISKDIKEISDIQFCHDFIKDMETCLQRVSKCCQRVRTADEKSKTMSSRIKSVVSHIKGKEEAPDKIALKNELKRLNSILKILSGTNDNDKQISFFGIQLNKIKLSSVIPSKEDEKKIINSAQENINTLVKLRDKAIEKLQLTSDDKQKQLNTKSLKQKESRFHIADLDNDKYAPRSRKVETNIRKNKKKFDIGL